MHKTVLIILAAVVALIVIVVLTGMRYLRADDEDDFDDESAAGRGQSRGRGEHPARDHWRSRHHDDDRHGDGHRQRTRVDRDGARRGTSRDRGDRERSERAVFAGVGAARRGSGRDGSSGRDADRAAMSRAGARRDGPGDRRGPSRDAAARRGGERGWDDAGRDDRRNSGPQRRVAGSRDYDKGSADELITASAPSGRGSSGRGGMRPDDFDDRTARVSGRDPHGNSGQNARPDGRRTSTSQSRKDDSLPDIKPRPSKTSPTKSKHDGDGDWPSTEWDELSDVDYWAELASDKPFTSAAPAPSSRPDRDRADARSKTDSGPVRAVDRRDMTDRRDNTEHRRDSTERREQLLPAARPKRQPVDAAFTPPVASDDHALGANARTDAYGSTELRRAIASGRTSTSGQHRMPQPAGDDPLTSPSFPRISDDSRSYRRSGGRGQGESQPQTRPHSAYPPVPPHPPVAPLDSQPGQGRTSGGYSQPATNGMDYAAAPPVTSSYPAPAPAAPAASYSPPAGNGYQAADPLSGPYSAPTSATNGYSTGYQAPLPAPSSVSFPAESFHAESYPPGSGYSPAPAAASYPPQPAEQPGYSSYPDVGQAQAAQPQSTGFSYSQPADPGFAGQLPAVPHTAVPHTAAQHTDSYLGYQPPLHPAEGYQVPASGMLPPQSVQPGYPSAPYSAAPYEAPVYPAPALAHEADGGYPADPYAVDPYGYPGYGSARLSDQGWRGRPLSDPRWDERSRQEHAWDDRSGTARHGYQQYWEDDDR